MFSRITVQLPAQGLLFRRLSGSEALSQSFVLQAELLSTDARIDRKSLLGKPVTFTLPTDGLLSAVNPRYINGKITQIGVRSEELGGVRYAVYGLTVESDLWPMKRDRNLRIFQSQTVPQIVQTLLKEYGVNVETRLAGSYRVWEYCVQYQESSFDFISRLMELEGMYYFFRHEADKHTLVLCDAPDQHQPFPGYETIAYHVTPSGGSVTEEGVSQWALSESVTPGMYSTDDYDFRKPNAWMLQARQNPVSPTPGSVDVYDWPGRFVEHGHGEYYARIRQEVWQVEHHMVSGSGTATGIAPGYTFSLLNAPHFSDNGKYLVTSAHYDFEENSYASGDAGATRHNIDFTVLPAAVTYRAKPETPWPRTHGPQTAKVVGPKGESIWTDKYGRVKVKFHWDRLAKGDDTSSCWVRVSSAWAGQGFGGVQIPRVGDEVVVDFINGDPDRPIVTGRVYNEASMPPWDLPGDATRMGFMTRSKDGHQANASYLFFEDKPGGELLNMHAEKDMNISVENDKTVAIDGSRTTTIGKEQNDEVTGDATFHYKQKRTTTVDQLESNIFNNGESTEIKNGRKLNLKSGGDESNITGGQKLNLNGTREVTISNGDILNVQAEGRKQHINGNVEEEINGNVGVNINGNWTQTVEGGTAFISSPNLIRIQSATKVEIDSPQGLYTNKGLNVSFNGASMSFNGISTSVNGTSISWTPINMSTSLTSIVHSPMNHVRSLTKIESTMQNVAIGLLHMFI
ncbi:type VI secretion system Vgr family protein [Pantoea ananatis]|uniref:type VI secretion system Vgr family protein n=2 Tax=Pantoea ananas TaxID=553 RepID=UPI000CF55FC9|nr:type VI secretion system tip protein TssI/VgrG [Pantoea ananatis]MDQ1226351.1 type VI secretion system secreted protein VgrG [Pantoea ananatis]MDR6088232.1 type VI secretion system secreted protein VgrG [Pantoea ananatis]PQK78276.1 ImpA family type VI secretion-associated protein [Pantoea ananatis]PWV69692.1 type VI secretion system secreted protein VgrG [Pantoea ananatis]RQN07187.1 type VI secretion system tip protein VgrG [Pantoea ananatis]